MGGRRPVTRLRAGLCVLVITGALGVGAEATVGGPAAGAGTTTDAAPKHTPKPTPKPKPPAQVATTRLTPGAVVSARTFSVRAGTHRLPQRMTLLRLWLGAGGVRLVPTAINGLIGTSHRTVLDLAGRQRALAAINGDFFDPSSPVGETRGGLMRDGRVYRSARADSAATLYGTADGRMHIGSPGYVGSVTSTIPGTQTQRTHTVRALNSLRSARLGTLVLVDHLHAGGELGPGCTVAWLAPSPPADPTAPAAPAGSRSGPLVVTSVTADVLTMPRLWGRSQALVGCGEAGQWLTWAVRPERPLQLTMQYAVPGLTSFIGGGTVLLQQGRPYRDTAASIRIPDTERNPLSFACVQRGGRSVYLGTVDGRWRWSAGMTYTELTRYLRSSLGCWSALMLDGGGSSTLVARLPGRPLGVLNHPSDGFARRVATGLLVLPGA